MPDLLDLLEERSAAGPFKGFACWAPGEVGEIMHREAAAPSRAVLLATHQPPLIRRVRVTDAGRYGSEEVVSQEDLLDGVLAEGDEALLVPVIGASGSGKSHLVLWMRAKLEESGSPNRRIIYLPKGETSLSRVIELILDGRTGGKFDEIRHAVANATRAMTTAEAARRLRDELAVAAGGIDEASAGAEQQPYRQHIKVNIAALLDDPVYAARLVGEDGALRRIVEQAQAGGSDEPAELKPEDLDVQWTAVELEDLSKPAKTFLSDLQAPDLHEATVEVLNEVRDRCLSRVFGVEPMQLVAVMRELRERLFAENPDLELILMIEDFTLLQGIQHDLLEAMIELPRRQGRQVMCAMKTVMAVTDGFFNRMLVASDTLRTRIAAQGHVYNLDVQYGADTTEAVDRQTLTEFAGRYLNAVRVGRAALDAAAPAVPNGCEHCAHQDVCHDAFGTSGDTAWGLYPFNEQALDRMARSRQDKFNPRDLLAVIAETLTTHAQDVPDGRFPSNRWEAAFDPRQHDRPQLPTLSLRTQELVNALPKSEQRTIALTFWGGVPDDLRNLPAGLHEAFDIPMAPDAGTVVPRPLRRRDREEGRYERPVDDIVEAVQQWRDGGRMDADFARILRRVVREAVTAALNPEGLLFSPQFVSEFFDRDQDVEIKNAPGGGRRNPNRFRVEFTASNEHALLFEGLLRAQREQHWAFETAHSTLVAFLTRVDDEAHRLKEFLADRRAERQSDQQASMALLAVSGLAAGQGNATDTRGLLAAALSSKRLVSDAMPQRWEVLVNQSGKRQSAVRDYALQAAHVSKSTDEPAAVDGGALLPGLRALSGDWQLPQLSDSAPQSTHMLRKVLNERLDGALEQAKADLETWRQEIGRLAGDPETVDERSKVWRAALDEARAGGFLAGADGGAPERTVSQLAPTLRLVDALLSQWDDLDAGRRIAGIAKAPWTRLEPTRAYLESVEATLQASISKAKTQDGDEAGASPVTAFEEALDELDQVLRVGQAEANV